MSIVGNALPVVNQLLDVVASGFTDEHQYIPIFQFNPGDLKDLAKAINEPIAVFAYGDRTKAQNIIIEIQQNGKNYLVGVHFDQERQGAFVSSIRSLFPKDNHEWLNWINQGKLLYANKEKLQTVIAQQRMTSADVSHLDMEPINKNNTGTR